MTAPGSNTCGHDDHSPAEASSAMTTKRRGYKDGGVRKSPDGRWEGTADVGAYGSGRRRKYVYGRTRAEVVERLRSVQRTVTEGLSRNVATLVEPVSVARARWHRSRLKRSTPSWRRRPRPAGDLLHGRPRRGPAPERGVGAQMGRRRPVRGIAPRTTGPGAPWPGVDVQGAQVPDEPPHHPPAAGVRRATDRAPPPATFQRRGADGWEENDLVFCTPGGTPLDRTEVSRRFSKLQEQAGVAHHRLYDCRHTAASFPPRGRPKGGDGSARPLVFRADHGHIYARFADAHARRRPSHGPRSDKRPADVTVKLKRPTWRSTWRSNPCGGRSLSVRMSVSTLLTCVNWRRGWDNVRTLKFCGNDCSRSWPRTPPTHLVATTRHAVHKPKCAAVV